VKAIGTARPPVTANPISVFSMRARPATNPS
jgi:hypothetical protein